MFDNTRFCVIMVLVQKGENMNKLEKTIDEYRIELGLSQRDMAFRLGQPLNTYVYQAKTNSHPLFILDRFCLEFSIPKQNVDCKRKESKK